jgi:hypothetical protein
MCFDRRVLRALWASAGKRMEMLQHCRSDLQGDGMVLHRSVVLWLAYEAIRHGEMQKIAVQFVSFDCLVTQSGLATYFCNWSTLSPALRCAS